MPMDAYSQYISLELKWKTLHELDVLSPQYWSMFFYMTKSVFKQCKRLNLMEDNYDPINILNNKIQEFMKKFRRYYRGQIITPNFHQIQQQLSSMGDDNCYILIRHKAYSTGTKTQTITKGQIIAWLDEIRDWVLDEVSDLPIRFSSPNMNMDM